MPRPIALTIDALSKALSPVAQTASQLAEKLGVSRATVHRKLLKLADERLVVKAGQGPRAGYRLPSPREEFERARQERVQPGLVRMEMPERLARLLQSALEFTSRLGIGQFEQIDELFRMGDVKRGDGGSLSYDEYDQVRAHADHLKSSLLGLPSNASHGIYSPHVHPSILQTWQMSKALRHRLAWDWQPTGGMGVWHDEPIVEGPPLGFEVYSQQDASGRRYLIELTADKAQLLVQACAAYASACGGDVHFLVEWATKGLLRNRDGNIPDAVAGMAGTQIAGWLALLLQAGKGPAVSVSGHNVEQAGQLLEAFLRDSSNPQVEQGAEGEFRISLAQSSPFVVGLSDLPEGMMLNFHKGKYRVIGPSKQDGALVILGESHSIQTALAMASNHSQRGELRSWTF